MACQCQKEIADLKDFINRWFVLVNRRFDDQEKNFFDQNKKLNEIHSYVFQLIENQQTKKSSTFSFDEVVPDNEVNNTDVSMYEKQTLDYAQPHSGDTFVDNSIINIENIKVEPADFHSAISVIESIDSSDNEIPVPGLSGFHGYQSATFRNNDIISENQLIAESFDYLTNAATNSSTGVAQETHRETGTNYSQKVDPVYEYFKLNENNPGSRCLVKGCMYDGKGRNVTTMKRHLESKHPAIFEEYKAKRKKAENSLASKKQETSRGQQVLTNLIPVNVKTSYAWKSARAQELRKKLAYLIGVSNVPVTIVNDFAFVEFCSALDSKFQLPKSLQTVRSCIFHLEEEMKMQVRERLSRAQSVSIILDIWSQFGVNCRFLGICASFHDAKYPYPTLAGLAIKEFPCPLTAGSIQELVNRVLNEFNIPESKVLRYVTNNGANVVAAFKRNVLVEDEISEETEENSNAPVNVFCGIEDQQSDDGDQLDLDKDVEDDTISNELRNFPQRLSSLDHHLILASDAAFSKKNFKTLKDQVQEFVNRCAQSENATELLQKLAKKKLLDSAPTRWLSFYFVAARVLELKETYIAFAMDMRWPIIFSWDLLTESKDLMKPLFDAVTFLEGDRYSTAPFVIPFILDLKARYSEIKTSFFQDSICELINQLDNRFDHFITPSSETWDPTYLLSTMMHPGQSQVLPRHLFDCGVAELKRFVRLSNFEDVVANVLSRESGIQSANEDFPLLQLKQRTISTEKRVETPSRAIAECEDYLRRLSTMSFAAKLDVIEFWKCSEFAALAPTFFSFLSIPATSASVERLFSAASLSTTGKQIRSGDAFLESRALLRFNHVFISF